MTGVASELDRTTRMFIGARPDSACAAPSGSFGRRAGPKNVAIEHQLRPAELSDDRIVNILVPPMEASLQVGRAALRRPSSRQSKAAASGAKRRSAAWSDSHLIDQSAFTGDPPAPAQTTRVTRSSSRKVVRTRTAMSGFQRLHSLISRMPS